jgi:hypothetical protein
MYSKTYLQKIFCKDIFAPMYSPALLEMLARERRADAYHQADLYRSAGRIRRQKAPPPRQRVGWFLVEVGLRLVTQH